MLRKKTTQKSVPWLPVFLTNEQMNQLRRMARDQKVIAPDMMLQQIIDERLAELEAADEPTDWDVITRRATGLPA